MQEAGFFVFLFFLRRCVSPRCRGSPARRPREARPWGPGFSTVRPRKAGGGEAGRSSASPLSSTSLPGSQAPAAARGAGVRPGPGASVSCQRLKCPHSRFRRGATLHSSWQQGGRGQGLIQGEAGAFPPGPFSLAPSSRGPESQLGATSCPRPAQAGSSRAQHRPGERRQRCRIAGFV